MGTAPFRNAPKLFRKTFPWLQKNTARGCVSQPLADDRVAAEPEFTLSGVHWRRGNRRKPGAKPFSRRPPAQARDERRTARLQQLSEAIVGLEHDALRRNRRNR